MGSIITDKRYFGGSGGLLRNSIHDGIISMHRPLYGGSLFANLRKAGTALIKKGGQTLFKKAKAKTESLARTAIGKAPEQINKLKRKVLNKMVEGAPPIKKHLTTKFGKAMEAVKKAKIKGDNLLGKKEYIKSVTPFSTDNLEGDKPKPSMALTPGPGLKSKISTKLEKENKKTKKKKKSTNIKKELKRLIKKSKGNSIKLNKK